MTLTMMKDLKELHKQIVEQKVIENYIFTEALLIGIFMCILCTLMGIFRLVISITFFLTR